MNYLNFIITVNICIYLCSCVNINNNIVITKNNIEKNHAGNIKIGVSVSKLLVEFGAFFKGKSYKNYILQLESDINLDFLRDKFEVDEFKDKQDLNFDKFKSNFKSKKENVLLTYNFNSQEGISDILKIFGKRANFKFSDDENLAYISIDLENVYYSVLNISNSNTALLHFSNVNFSFTFQNIIDDVFLEDSEFYQNLSYKDNILKINTNILKFSKYNKVLKIKVKLNKTLSNSIV